MRNHDSSVIVGAGLVGSLLALDLAKKGQSVRVFERRPDMRKEKISAGRSINLAVSVRGLHALDQVGLKEKVLEQAVAMKGRLMHSQKGELSFQAYGKDDSECIHSVSRAGLNQLLMTEAEKTGNVEIRFHSRAKSVDFEKGRIDFEDDRTHENFSIESEVFYGTDGAFSAVRKEMQNLPGFKCSESTLDYGYKELEIPSVLGSKLEKNALHIWPRGNFMLIALPNRDGSFTCTLFLPLEGRMSFQQLKSVEAVELFFKEQFSDAVPLIPDLKNDFFENPTGHMTTIKMTPWNVGSRFLLLGDAAHGIVPFFGQGMNCGFEDVAIFSEAMRKTKNLEKVFNDFGAHRKIDSDAIADMAVENFIEMRDKVGDPKFLLQKEVEKTLLKKFPGQFLSRYGLVSFSRVSYRLARQTGVIADEILDELCQGLSSADQVDLAKASVLVKNKMEPFLKEKLYGSSSQK